MINYGKWQFGAAPRTGTTWVMRAAAQVGFTGGTGGASKSQVHVPPVQRHPAQFNLTLVRHPYEWLRSYYYFLQGGAVGLTTIDVLAPLVREAQSFEQFILSYAEQAAGQYTRIIESYHGDSVIRTEELTLGIIELFGTLGVAQHWLDKVKQLSPINVDLHKAKHDDEILYLQEIIQKADASIYEQYDYQLSGAVV